MGAIAGGVAAAVTSVLLIILFIWAFMKKNSGTETTEEAREPYSKVPLTPLPLTPSLTLHVPYRDQQEDVYVRSDVMHRP